MHSEQVFVALPRSRTPLYQAHLHVLVSHYSMFGPRIIPEQYRNSITDYLVYGLFSVGGR